VQHIACTALSVLLEVIKSFIKWEKYVSAT
jgi:hypothetical protein